jgi:flagellar hook-length control protein FliK
MMLNGLQTSSKTVPLDTSAARLQLLDAETTEHVSFDQILKLREKQLQQEQELSASSVAAAFAASQTALPGNLLPLPTIGTNESSAETEGPKSAVSAFSQPAAYPLETSKRLSATQPSPATGFDLGSVNQAQQAMAKAGLPENVSQAASEKMAGLPAASPNTNLSAQVADQKMSTSTKQERPSAPSVDVRATTLSENEVAATVETANFPQPGTRTEITAKAGVETQMPASVTQPAFQANGDQNPSAQGKPKSETDTPLVRASANSTLIDVPAYAKGDASNLPRKMSTGSGVSVNKSTAPGNEARSFLTGVEDKNPEFEPAKTFRDSATRRLTAQPVKEDSTPDVNLGKTELNQAEHSASEPLPDGSLQSSEEIDFLSTFALEQAEASSQESDLQRETLGEHVLQSPIRQVNAGTELDKGLSDPTNNSPANIPVLESKENGEDRQYENPANSETSEHDIAQAAFHNPALSAAGDSDSAAGNTVEFRNQLFTSPELPKDEGAVGDELAAQMDSEGRLPDLDESPATAVVKPEILDTDLSQGENTSTPKGFVFPQDIESGARTKNATVIGEAKANSSSASMVSQVDHATFQTADPSPEKITPIQDIQLDETTLPSNESSNETHMGNDVAEDFERGLNQLQVEGGIAGEKTQQSEMSPRGFENALPGLPSRNSVLDSDLARPVTTSTQSVSDAETGLDAGIASQRVMISDAQGALGEAEPFDAEQEVPLTSGPVEQQLDTSDASGELSEVVGPVLVDRAGMTNGNPGVDVHAFSLPTTETTGLPGKEDVLRGKNVRTSQITGSGQNSFPLDPPANDAKAAIEGKNMKLTDPGSGNTLHKNADVDPETVTQPGQVPQQEVSGDPNAKSANPHIEENKSRTNIDGKATDFGPSDTGLGENPNADDSGSNYQAEPRINQPSGTVDVSNEQSASVLFKLRGEGSGVSGKEKAHVKNEESSPLKKQSEVNQPSGIAAPADGAVKQPTAAGPGGDVPSNQLHPDVKEVFQQVIRHLNSNLKNGPTSMRMQLNPRELGAIDVQMVSDSHGVHVTFFAEQASTGKLLETQLDQLRVSLVESGVHLSGLDIGQQNQSGQRGGSFEQSPNFTRDFSRNIPEESTVPQEGARLGRSAGQSGEIDYLI